jgi:hypothetical protein
MDRIDAVTSSALSRLGNPISFALQDESGTYTTRTRCGRSPRPSVVARRHGRPDDGAHEPVGSVGEQRRADDVGAQTDDVFKFYRVPPTKLRFMDKRERRKILEFVYAGSDHVNLDSIEAECFELMQKDPAQAERFFGGRVVQGHGSWLPDGLWEARGPVQWLPPPEPGTSVCGGFDGSENDDWTAIRLETLRLSVHPALEGDGRADGVEPGAARRAHPAPAGARRLGRAGGTYKLERIYCDPGFNDPHDPTSWISEIEMWDRLHGPETFVPWQMGGQTRTRAVHASLVRFEADLRSGALTHDGCPITAAHITNARKIPKPGDRFILGKPAQHQKIDAAVTSVLCHEAAADARAAGWAPPKPRPRMVVRR